MAKTVHHNILLGLGVLSWYRSLDSDVFLLHLAGCFTDCFREISIQLSIIPYTMWFSLHIAFVFLYLSHKYSLRQNHPILFWCGLILSTTIIIYFVYTYWDIIHNIYDIIVHFWLKMTGGSSGGTSTAGPSGGPSGPPGDGPGGPGGGPGGGGGQPPHGPLSAAEREARRKRKKDLEMARDRQSVITRREEDRYIQDTLRWQSEHEAGLAAAEQARLAEEQARLAAEQAAEQARWAAEQARLEAEERMRVELDRARDRWVEQHLRDSERYREVRPEWAEPIPREPWRPADNTIRRNVDLGQDRADWTDILNRIRARLAAERNRREVNAAEFRRRHRETFEYIARQRVARAAAQRGNWPYGYPKDPTGKPK